MTATSWPATTSPLDRARPNITYRDRNRPAKPGHPPAQQARLRIEGQAAGDHLHLRDRGGGQAIIDPVEEQRRSVAGEMSNGEAAQRCGYASVQGFLKAFRRRFGRTPGGRPSGPRLGES